MTSYTGKFEGNGFTMKITTDDLIHLSFHYGRNGASIAWAIAGEWKMNWFSWEDGMEWDGICLDDVGYPLFMNLLRQGKWK